MSNNGRHEKGIDAAEFSARRERVGAALKDSVGIVFAGAGDASLRGAWEADASFRYLTGIADEAGAALLLDPKAEDPKRREILFLRPLNPEVEAWDGYRDPINAAMKSRVGFRTVLRTTMLPRVLTDLARRRGKLACLHPFAVYDAAVSPDLAVFRKVTERVAGASVIDRTQVLPSLRAIKSAAELRLMERALVATAAGFEAALATLRPGVGERDVHREIERAFVAAGAEGSGYNPIVGSGVSGTVLHYMANSGTCREGELLVIDAGARFMGYCADITRTFPVSGRFTSEQRDLYDVVLRAEEAAIRAVRPGARMHEVAAAARDVIERAGHGDAFIHGIGHQLGLEVHDATPDGPLAAGMVVTIEPGVYFKDRGVGIRIEDDVLVTRAGSRVLSAMIPKSARDIEARMPGRHAGRRVAKAPRRRPVAVRA